MAITNNLTEFADNETAQYFTPAQLAESTNITHVGAVLNNRLNYKAYNSLAKMTSKVVVALGDFIVNYSGITTGTIDINTTVTQWGIFLASIMTDYKLANSVNATTPLSISGTTTNSKTTNGHTHAITTGSVANGNENPVTGGAVYSFINTETSAASPLVITGTTVNGFSAGGHTHAISTGTVGDGSTDIVDGGAVYTYGNPYFTNTSNIKNSSGGFSAGNGAEASFGGGAIGNGASAAIGGAVGLAASVSNGGGAVGSGASAAKGFAGGRQAVATGELSVQLGTGTNPDDETIQYLSNKVFNADLTKLAPSTTNDWTNITSLTDTPLNLTGKYMFYLTTANGTTVGTYYDTVMNLGTTNTLTFGYNAGSVRIFVSTTGAISGVLRPDSGTTATLTSINLWYKKMW